MVLNFHPTLRSASTPRMSSLPKMLLFVSLVLLALPAPSRPHIVGRMEMCVNACRDAFTDVTFATTDKKLEGIARRCHDSLRVASGYLCAQQHCPPDEIHAGVHQFEARCHDEVGVTVPSYEAMLANMTLRQGLHSLNGSRFNGVPVVGKDEVDAGLPINVTVYPSDRMFELAYRSWESWVIQWTIHHYYGWGTMAFWGLVLLAGMLNRLFTLIVVRAASRRHSGASSAAEAGAVRGSSPCGGRTSPRWLRAARAWTRRKVLLPATFGYRHMQPLGWGTLPTRVQSLLVALFVVLNIFATAVGHSVYGDSIFYPTKAEQTWIFVSDRAGIIAAVNFPLLWVFATRNDVFMWLTGWSFATFNVFHKWLARIIVLQSILHGVGYTVDAFITGGFETYKEWFKEDWWYTGVIALCAMGVMLVFSALPFRKHVYELFLYTHIVLAVVALVSMFYHIKAYDGKYEPYLWPCVAIWAFDRLLRVVRLAVLNKSLILAYLFRRHRQRPSVLADARYDTAANLIRLSVPQRLSGLGGLLQPGPGAHYYLHFPSLWRGFGNHPFSLAGWTPSAELRAVGATASVAPLLLSSVSTSGTASPTPSAAAAAAAADGDDEKHAARVGARTTASSSDEFERYDNANDNGGATADVDGGSSSGEGRLIFFVRPYGGITRHLRRALLSAPSQRLRVPVLVEGPYGEPAPLLSVGHATYDTLLFVAGGSGMMGLMGYLQQYVEACLAAPARHGASSVSTTPPPKNVRVVWTVRELTFAQRVLGDEDLRGVLAAAPRSVTGMRLDVYVTGATDTKAAAAVAKTTVASSAGPTSPMMYSEKGGGVSGGVSAVDMPDVTFHMQQRPDVARIVAETARAAVGRAAVVVCGPARMADDARRAAVRAVRDGHDSLGYYEEVFSW